MCGRYTLRSRGRAKPYGVPESQLPLLTPGIWDKWQSGDVSITSCAIITTTPNELLAEIHDRMPVIILTADAYDAWLRDDADPRELKQLLALVPPRP
jgi:putative SOS response-associated peptidase YedK